ncbi:ATP-binding cassette domain-containing protein [Luteipulveratus sp. YIM 133132]|uniref:ATP-binding cassette domain-containing protein n=1 Tax=Luteipulveratus flavus TaxID=3031728 RepID=UPI0023B1F90B|nr:ATP-binding cassette domain-containing protein [Luteipulveratus sp. YIM 133132]MDE9365088.1 ATP-binding cassette domain-containing protein [Luteipulveratus sp. YIM 133132]
MSGRAVEVSDLHKTLGTHHALRGLDLHVDAGRVLGLLGPNGAGKTTTVRILSTLLAADRGSVRVAGFDVRTEADEVRRRIGLTGQYAAVDELLTGRQNLELIGNLQHLRRADSRARARELIDQFGLQDAADRPASGYSGGMRRRLDLAASLVARPSVLFIDEPTTGLDPASRIQLWATVRTLVDDGVTVLLTTQYLEEADELADTIVVMRDGRAVADGTPAQLKASLGGNQLVVTLVRPEDCVRVAQLLQPFGTLVPDIDERRSVVTIEVTDALTTLEAASRALRDRAVEVRTLLVRPPSLDEVFLHLTGDQTVEPAAVTTAAP